MLEIFNFQEAEVIANELARLPADMRKRVKVVFKEGEDDSGSAIPPNLTLRLSDWLPETRRPRERF